jgi:glycosyltransferase involved in cell wall biosynthesis
MLSIIVCTRNKMLSNAFIDNIKDTVGIDFELISIDNSGNDYSIFSAYNAGFAKSKFPYVCFVHDDVLLHTQNWGEKVIAHLQSPGIGRIGLAGGDLVTRVPASWSTLISRSENIIKSDKTGRKKTVISHIPPDFNGIKRSVILLDGVFICMNRTLFNSIKFDEQFSGFHGYDFDISIQSTIAGFTNYVIFDINLEHFSVGKTDDIYYRNLIGVFKKWGEYLPLIGKNITQEETHKVGDFEKERLYQLTKKMIRKGFSTSEIIEQTKYYSNLTGFRKASKNMILRIYFIRLFSCPKYLFK